MSVTIPTAWAIIPARGGSKGIPGKNLRLVAGRSLIARAVGAVRGSRHVGRCLVSTDDAGIAEAARQAGAEVIARPADLATDAASSESALLHVLDTLEAAGETLPEVVVFVQCTSPFVSSQDIDGTLNALVAAGADTAHTAAPFHSFLWSGFPDGTASPVGHEATTRLRRQDLPPTYRETGAVYAMRTRGFRTERHRFFGRATLHVVSWLRSIEIDDWEDLSAAEALSPLVEKDG